MSKTKVKKKKETKFSLFLKNNKYILISALIAFAVMQLVYFCFSLIPYGDMTILRMDLYHQYGPLFAELYDRLTSGESLIYSWNSGLEAASSAISTTIFRVPLQYSFSFSVIRTFPKP